MDPDAPYRIAIAWDTETGEVTYTVAMSCWAEYLCVPQDEITDDGANHLTVREDPYNMTLEAKYGGLNSVLPCCSVEGKLSIGFGGPYAPEDYVRVYLEGDDYPSFQVVQYRNDGTSRYLAQDMTPTGGPWGVKSMPVWTNRNRTWITGEPVE